MSREREKLFESLFEIAENYNIPLTNNPDMHRELPSAGDFCGDVESAVLAAGYRLPSSSGEIQGTEWGTDYWGEIMTEPTEEHARKVCDGTGANLYSRPPMGVWNKHV